MGQRTARQSAARGAAPLRIRFGGGARPGGGGIVGRVFATIFFLFFLGMGCLFLAWMVRSAWGAVRTYGWTPATCRILESRVVREDGGSKNYVFETRYGWDAGGAAREGTVYKPGYSGSAQVADAEAIARRYEKGAEIPCWISPQDPAKAVLVRPSLWTILVVFFPLIFVAVGSGGLYFVWSGSGKKGSEDPSRRAISRAAASPAQTAGCLAAFFGVFLLVGLGTSLFFALPALKVVRARTWREVPCTVISSEVRSHSDSDSTTYSVDILYEYEAGGRTRRSNRYEFLGGSSGGSAAKEAIVAANPPGTRRSCWVDQNDPDAVVMHRGFSKTYWVATVPVVFAGAGLAGILFALRTRRGGPRAPGDAASFTAPAPASAGPVTLATPHPVAKLFGMIFVALFWNGIVSVFLWQIIRGWKSGGKPFGLSCFLIPFVLVGLGLIVGVFYSLLATFNPRPRLTLSTRSIPPGGSATLSWTFTGAASRLKGLKVSLEAKEEAKYRRGTTTYTDRETFATIPVYESPFGAGVSDGSAVVRVPAGAMHSFTAPSNRIVWTLKFSGEIPRWPDVTENVEIEVAPGPDSGDRG